MSQNIVRIVLANQLSVLSFEILAKGFLSESVGVVCGFADLVLHLQFAWKIVFFGSEGFGGGQVGDVAVLFVLFAVTKARLVVGDGSVWL